MKKLLSMALVAGALLMACGSQAWAREDCDSGYGYRSRWHRRPYHHNSVVVVYQTRPDYYRRGYYGRSAEVIQAPIADTVVINIPNANGSYTPVVLRRVGGIYVGPRGEQYLNLPTVDQLKPVYGLK